MTRRHTYPGTLTRRGDSWWWRLGINGRQYSRSFAVADYPTKRAAGKHAATVLVAEVEAEAGRRRAGVRDVTVSNLLDAFEREYRGTRKPITEGTRRSHQDTTRYLRKFFVEREGDPRVAAVAKGDVARYFDWRRTANGRTVSQRTLRRDYAVLHLVFAFAVDRDWRADNPVAAVRKPPPGDAREPVVLTDDQLDALYAACADRPMLSLFVRVGAEAGLRPNSETLWLRWEDVDLKRRTLRVVSGRDGHRTKTGRSRTLPLSEALVAAFRDHAARYRLAGGSPWVFHHLSGARHHRAGERINDLRRAFAAAATRAGLPAGVWPYDLRHTRITRWVRAGHNLALVQKAAGHASIRTTLIYVHLNDDDLSVLVEASARPVAGDPKFSVVGVA